MQLVCAFTKEKRPKINSLSEQNPLSPQLLNTNHNKNTDVPEHFCALFSFEWTVLATERLQHARVKSLQEYKVYQGRPYRVVYKSSGQVSPMTLFEQRVGLNAEHPERVLVKRQQSW